MAKNSAPNVNSVMKDLKNDIAKGSFKKVYLLFGPEQYLVKQYRDMLVEALLPDADELSLVKMTTIEKAFSVNDIISECDTLPFFSDRRVVMLSDTGLFSSEGRALAEYIPNMPETTTLIITEEKADKKTVLYKTIAKQGTAAEFTTPDEKTLISWVSMRLGEAKLKITAGDAAFFVETAGINMYNLSNEIDKLISYCDGRSVVRREDIILVTVNDIEDKIFVMTDKVSRGDIGGALPLLDDLYRLNVKPIQILGALKTTFSRLAEIKKRLEDGESIYLIGKSMNIYSRYLEGYAAIVSSYKYKDLLGAYDSIVQTGTDITSGLVTEQETALVLLMSSLL